MEKGAPAGGKEDKEFDVTAPALDADAIVAEVRKRAAARRGAGEESIRPPTALDYEKELTEEDFLRYYLQVVERLGDVNYGDFEIVSKGGPFGRLEVLLKKTIWKVMRFYTYRLFSQQREFDCQVAEALQSHYRWSREEIDRLQAEIAELRTQLGQVKPPAPS